MPCPKCGAFPYSYQHECPLAWAVTEMDSDRPVWGFFANQRDAYAYVLTHPYYDKKRLSVSRVELGSLENTTKDPTYWVWLPAQASQ